MTGSFPSQERFSAENSPISGRNDRLICAAELATVESTELSRCAIGELKDALATVAKREREHRSQTSIDSLRRKAVARIAAPTNGTQRHVAARARTR